MRALTGPTALRSLGTVLVAVLCLGTAVTLSKPAVARVWVGFNFGYPAYYYAPPYSDPYYSVYYPYYGYPYWRWHQYRHARYWRHHGCHWHAHHCYW